jgi:type I restriction enzyme S subunit
VSGWQEVPLGEVMTLHYGKALDSAMRAPDGSVPVYGANGIKDYAEVSLTTGPVLVIGRKGSAGEVTRAEGPLWPLDVTYYTEHDAERVEFGFLQHMLRALDLPGLAKGVKPGINRNDVYALSVPLPPLGEQKRIVAVLDQAFAALDRARANAEANLADAKVVFDTHVDGVFLDGMKTWNARVFGDLADFRNGINFTMASRGRRVRVLGVKDFQNHFYAPDTGLDYVTIDGEFDANDSLRSGDIVFVRSNGNPGLIGRSLVVETMSERTAHSGFTIRARPRSEEVLSSYLGHFLKSSAARKKMTDSGIGTNIKSLNQGTLSQMLVPYPDQIQQAKIVERLQAVREAARRIEAVCTRKLVDIAALRQSLLQAAFSGQLA